jgi:DNA-binding GntR family transcriptional regulator
MKTQQEPKYGTSRRREARPAAGFEAVTPGREIYERIREAVLDHLLPPGTKLKEVALAEAFSVNRSVIRTVLARLAHDRLVMIRPNRGAIVASPTVEESRDLFSARRSIEAVIVDTVARRITRDEVRELRSIIKNELEAYRRGAMREGLKLSIHFHRTLAQMAGNRVLCEFMDQLISRTPLAVLAYKGSALHASCPEDEHSRIVDALAAGNADKAVALMRAHVLALEGQLNLRDEEQPPDLAEIFRARPR